MFLRRLCTLLVVAMTFVPPLSWGQSSGLGDIASREMKKRGDAVSTDRTARSGTSAGRKGQAQISKPSRRPNDGKRIKPTSTRATPGRNDQVVGRVGQGRMAGRGDKLVGRVGSSGNNGPSFGDQLMGAVVTGVASGVINGLSNGTGGGYQQPSSRRTNSRGRQNSRQVEVEQGRVDDGYCMVEYWTPNPRTCAEQGRPRRPDAP